MTKRTFRVGADIGGTFTDIVFLENDETIHIKKTSSTPADYSQGIIRGITELLADLGGTPDEIIEVVHATTVATNTVLEGKGALTSLVTTKGFRDVIEIGRLRVPELYNLNYEKPIPLVPRRRRCEVLERIGADGNVVTELDEHDVRDVAEQIKKDKAQAVAISFIHAYTNPDHEQKVARILKDLLGEGVFVSCSSEVLPEIREYERASTVVVNAYLGPIVKSYLQSLIVGLRQAGIKAPLQVMQSSGGVMNAQSAMAKPAAIIESGPAAGVIAAAGVGAVAQYKDLITIDMGGTTAKAAMIENGEPARTTEYEVGAGINVSSKLVKGGGHAVKMPFIDVSEIGAGGGSIVRVDAGGLMQVGPDSAGSVPGPVCYDAGGTDPTLTDAMVLLGYINPHFIAGGAVRLNALKSQAVIAAKVAEPTNMGLLEAAHGVYKIAAATMMRAVKAVSTFRGRDPREFTLFAFGGNGPLMAVEIARLLDMHRVVIPPNPGVFSALGLLYSATQHELIQTLYKPIDELSPDEIEVAFKSVEARTRDALIGEGYPASDVFTDRQADLRYSGQAFELTVPVPANEKGSVDLPVLVRRFHTEHERTYGHSSSKDPVELVNVRVIGQSRSQQGRAYRPSPVRLQHLGDGLQRVSERQAYFGDEHGIRQARVIERRDLMAQPLSGPIIIEEYDSTCVIQPGWRASLDDFGNIIIETETL